MATPPDSLKGGEWTRTAVWAQVLDRKRHWGVVNVRDWGAYGDGVHDDTAALQAWITAIQGTAQVGYLPAGDYLISSTLIVSDTIHIVGAGARALYGTYADNPKTAGNLPSLSPYLLGSVIVVGTANTDAIHVNVTGKAVYLHGFGIRFNPPYATTGHGIVAIPAALSVGGYDHGILGSRFTDIKVFGHDGDHYGFWLTNVLYASLYDCHAWGGGGLYLEAYNGEGWNYGGLNIQEFYNQCVVGGTAHGIRGVSAQTTGQSNSHLNNLFFSRVQVTVANYNISGVTAPTSAQQVFYMDDDIFSITCMAQDWETNVGSQVTMPNNQYFIDPTGYNPNPENWTAISASAKPRTMTSNLDFIQTESEASGGLWKLGGVDKGAGFPYLEAGRHSDSTGYWYTYAGWALDATPASSAGTTAGTIYWNQPQVGVGYKKVVIVLDGYENATTTAQTITFPVAFTYTPAITSQPSGFGATVSKTELTLPISMSSAVSGVIIVEGI